jgi:hypothetical protein
VISSFKVLTKSELTPDGSRIMNFDFDWHWAEPSDDGHRPCAHPLGQSGSLLALKNFQYKDFSKGALAGFTGTTRGATGGCGRLMRICIRII